MALALVLGALSAADRFEARNPRTRARHEPVPARSGARRTMPLSERLYRRFFLKYHGRYLITDLQSAPRRQSLDYIERHMAEALIFRRPLGSAELRAGRGAGGRAGARIRRRRRREPAPPGRGRATGRSTASTVSRACPSIGPAPSSARASSRGRPLPEVPANVTLHQGWFEHTCRVFLEAQPRARVAFLHVDCDIYSSTATVLRASGPAARAGLGDRVRRVFQLSELAAPRMEARSRNSRATAASPTAISASRRRTAMWR